LAKYGIASYALVSSEYYSYEEVFDRGDVAIAISQSGETIDTIKAVKRMRERGVYSVIVTNVIGSTLSREGDVVLYTRAGPEIGVAATKTFTTQVALLSALYIAVGRHLGFDVYNAEYGLNKLAEYTRRTIENVSGIAKELSERIKNSSSAYYLSRGLGLSVAMEGALKLKEVAYIHAEAYPAGESKHGPIALVGERFPVVFVMSDPNSRERILGNVSEMRARGAYTIGVLPENSEFKRAFKTCLEVPDLDAVLNSIIYVIPLQLLAYYTSVALGRDPDKPRNLAKTVTVE